MKQEKNEKNLEKKYQEKVKILICKVYLEKNLTVQSRRIYPEGDETIIMENIFRDYFFRDNRVEPIPLEENIINDFSPEEERFILDRILLRQASNVYRRHFRPNRMR